MDFIYNLFVDFVNIPYIEYCFAGLVGVSLVCFFRRESMDRY